MDASNIASGSGSTSEDTPWEAIVTLVMICLMFVVLSMEKAPPDMVLMGTTLLFVPLQIISAKDIIQSFGNEAVVVIMSMLVVSSALVNTGSLELVKKLFVVGETQTLSLHFFLLKVLVVVGIMSAFVANTPVVAIFIPVMQEIAKKYQLPVSKLLLPVSYAAILGGTCTLIGTSINLVAAGLAEQYIPNFQIGIFDIGRIGLPVLMAGLFYMVIVGPFILPDRGGVPGQVDNSRDYITVFTVKARSDVINRTLLQNSLIDRPGLRLLQVRRDSEVIDQPSSDCVLRADDQLVFSGLVENIVSLTRLQGLTFLEDRPYPDFKTKQRDRILVEAVVASGGPLMGQSLTSVNFRSTYKAIVVGVHRHGETTVPSTISTTPLAAGDSLLLMTTNSFLTSFRNTSTFALLHHVEEYVTIRHQLAPVALLLCAAMVIVSTATEVPLVISALFAAGLMIVFTCLTSSEAREAVKVDLVIMIACGFSLSKALVNSGAALLIAGWLVKLAQNDTGLIISIYVVTTILNAVVTNQACVAIMFPIAYNAAKVTGAPMDAIVFTLMFAGSADFATPYGYVTNLMVYRPGGYKFLDYIYFGGPMQIIAGVFAVAIILTIDYWWLWTLAFALLNAIAIGVILWRRKTHSEPSASIQMEDLQVIARDGTISYTNGNDPNNFDDSSILEIEDGPPTDQIHKHTNKTGYIHLQTN